MASDQLAPGIVGLAASRLLDEFYRPSVVVSVDGQFDGVRHVPSRSFTSLMRLTWCAIYSSVTVVTLLLGFTIRTDRLPEAGSAPVLTGAGTVWRRGAYPDVSS